MARSVKDDSRARYIAGPETLSLEALTTVAAYLPAAFWFRGTPDGFDYWSGVLQRLEAMKAEAEKRAAEYDREQAAAVAAEGQGFGGHPPKEI